MSLVPINTDPKQELGDLSRTLRLSAAMGATCVLTLDDTHQQLKVAAALNLGTVAQPVPPKSASRVRVIRRTLFGDTAISNLLAGIGLGFLISLPIWWLL